jgi:hypothetical protein
MDAHCVALETQMEPWSGGSIDQWSQISIDKGPNLNPDQH